MLGVGDGVRTLFGLRKGYASGAETYWRGIAKPVAGTVTVAVGGVAQVAGAGFGVDPETGQVQLSAAPAAGAAVTAGFEFDVPVRFDTDRIVTSISGFVAGEIPSVPVIEVRL